jgi:hypothetical protein
LIRCSITYISKTEFFPAFHAAFQAAITERNIKGGFKGARLAPLELEAVLLKLDMHLRTLTPVEEEARLPNAWVLKMLKIVLKASS